MSDLRLLSLRSVSASGPLVFRPADGAVPAGYLAVGAIWAMALPPEVNAAGLRETPEGLAFEGSAAATALSRNQVEAFWKAETAALLPVANPRVPWSSAGLAGGAALAQPAASEVARRDRIAADNAARAARRIAAHGIPFVDLVMRQIAVLRLPAAAEAALWRDGAGDWVLEFRESGPMGHLFAELSWMEPGKKTKNEHLECRAPAGPAAHAHGVLIALARAVQLAQVAVASGLDPQDRLRVKVSHTGSSGKMLALTLRPEDRGLPLARLARQVAGNLLMHRTGLQGQLESLPCGPTLVADNPAAAAAAAAKGGTKDLAEPLRWYRQGEATALQRVYAGGRASSHRFPAGLPFALAPHDAALTVPHGPARRFHDLPATERGAYVDWLSGPRHADGFQHAFADLYLQGLEYRVLADSAPPEECEALLSEVRRIKALLGADDALALRVDTLLDWCAAIGKRPTGPLSTEGPLTCLALLGKAVAQGRALDVEDLHVLRRVLGEGGPDGLPKSVSADWSSALTACPPARPLAARYVSLSGICDVERHVFQHDGRTVPDLRASAWLRALLSQGRAGAETEQ